MNIYGNIESIPEGSIFLTNGNSLFAKVIRKVQGENFQRDTYTHGGIYLGGQRRLVAHQILGRGAVIQPIDVEIASAQSISVWSPPAEYAPRIPLVLNDCYASEARYSLTGLLYRLGWPVTPKQGMYCTEAVLMRFLAAGIPVMGTRTEVLPNELRDALEKSRAWKLCYKKEN